MKKVSGKFNYISEIVPFGLILTMLALSLYFFAEFPGQVATHWNAAGQVDDYSNKANAAFFMPILAVVLYVILLIVPSLDPKKEQYVKFERAYHIIKTSILAFMLFIYVVVGLNGLGVQIPTSQAIISAVGLFFVVIGAVMPQIKQNWFFGIRTPWTLSSEKVWDKTHSLGSKLFVLAGFFVMAASLLTDAFLVPTILIAVFIAAIIPLIYSYILYSQEKR